MPALSASALPYRPALTGLRAVAVAVVVAQHWLQPGFPLGEVGPSLFFVLSSYLISGIIWKERAYPGAGGRWKRRLGVFYLRRGLRVLPAYYAVVLGCALLPLAAVRAHPGWFLLPVANLLIYQGRGWPDGVGHLWTIAVEIQFYLLWPWLLGAIGRRPAWLVGLAVGAVGFRVLWSCYRHSDMVHLLLPVSFDAFALGALLQLAAGGAWLARVARGRYVALAWAGWAALRLLPVVAGWAAPQAAGLAGWLAATEFLTVGWLLQPSRPGRWLGHPVLHWVGQRSYGMYLIHLPLLVFWQRLVYHAVPGAAGRAALMGRWPVLLVLGPVLLLLSAASWRWLEQPIDRLKERFRYAD
ncbi:acyltransferase family protein [Hymenobacter daeguensis]